MAEDTPGNFLRFIAKQFRANPELSAQADRIETIAKSVDSAEKRVYDARLEKDQKDGALRRANRILAERIQDVDDLTEHNRRFWKEIDAMEPTPRAIYDAWNRTAIKKPSLVGFGR